MRCGFKMVVDGTAIFAEMTEGFCSTARAASGAVSIGWVLLFASPRVTLLALQTLSLLRGAMILLVAMSSNTTLLARLAVLVDLLEDFRPDISDAFPSAIVGSVMLDTLSGKEST